MLPKPGLIVLLNVTSNKQTQVTREVFSIWMILQKEEKASRIIYNIKLLRIPYRILQIICYYYILLALL